MCGRYASFREAQDLADAFAVDPEHVAEDARLLPPSWNVAPTDPVRVVVERAPRAAEGTDDGTGPAAGSPDEPEPGAVRSLRLVRWGLVPGWAKDPSVGSRMINARVESVVEKPAFRRALAARRCLVPAEGWFEWRKPPGDAPPRTAKQPYWIHHPDGDPVAFAGLYEFWRDRTVADDDPHRWLVTMTIITGGAPTDDPVLAGIHDRRPVVLGAGRWDAWLDPALDDPAAAAALLGDPAPRLTATPVSTAVNSVRTDGPELLEPVEPPEWARLGA